MLDLYKLQIFTMVVEEGSFSAAAERLYITQSAISQHIKDLEASLGQILFQRGWRGVQLTPEGEILLTYARDIFALVAKAEHALTNVEQLASGKVSFGATPGIGVYLAPEWVQAFRARYPRLTVALSTGITAQIVADVLAHRLDFGVIEGELDDFRQVRLGNLVMEAIDQVVITGVDHPFREKTGIKHADLNQQSFIMRQSTSQSRIWLERTLKQYGIHPVIAAEFDNLESIKRAVASGQCLTILPPYVVQQEVAQGILRVYPIDGQPFKRSLKLIWDKNGYLSPTARAFLRELSQRYSVLREFLDNNR